jgi:hypothetical protein
MRDKPTKIKELPRKGGWGGACVVTTKAASGGCSCGWIFDGGEGTICTVHHNIPGEKEYCDYSDIITWRQRMVNARVIQAAPDMVQALLALSKVVNFNQPPFKDCREALEFALTGERTKE